MAVPTICLVTVTLESQEILAATVPVNVELLVAAPLPVAGGKVKIDLEPLLGVEQILTVPCPSAGFQAQIDLSPIVVANLVIQVQET